MAVQLTESAARRIQKQIQERGRGLGLRVAVKKSGCSGYSYVLDYADEAGADDVVYEAHGARIVIRRGDLPILEGITVDFRREGLGEAFRFDNPNAKAHCGCGESFHIEAEKA